MFKIGLVLLISTVRLYAVGSETVDLASESFDCYTAGFRLTDILPASGGDGVWSAGAGGLFHYRNDGTFVRKYTRKDGLSSHNIQQLLIGNDGALWIASTKDVMRLKGDELVVFGATEGLTDERVYTIGMDGNGVIYAGTHKGVCRFDGERFTPFDDTHEFARRRVRDIHRAGDGTLWFAKENGVSHYISEGRWEIYQKDPLRPGKRSDIGSNNALCIASDLQGRILLGTKLGLTVSSGTGWKRYLYRERFNDGTGLKDNRIETLAVDSNNYVWIGHGDSKDFDRPVGVTYFKDEEWHHLTMDEGLISDRVYRIRVSNDNTKWMATSDGGMSWKDGQIVTYPAKSELPVNRILDIVRVGENTVAINAGNRMSVYENGLKIKESEVTAKIRSPRSEIMATSPDGIRWSWSRKTGLQKEAGKERVRYRLNGRAFPREITALCFEREDVLWVGTASEGAIRIRLSAEAGMHE